MVEGNPLQGGREKSSRIRIFLLNLPNNSHKTTDYLYIVNYTGCKTWRIQYFFPVEYWNMWEFIYFQYFNAKFNDEPSNGNLNFCNSALFKLEKAPRLKDIFIFI